ncbi:Crp/Fnr family transcriptional regulator [Maritalea sp. S77]|uniref:Crp/Fnr family transcriptional regulator n=1 Tax=Maritalea sp. S77 TaxID=3415125 RepID=UPI003C7D08C2
MTDPTDHTDLRQALISAAPLDNEAVARLVPHFIEKDILENCLLVRQDTPETDEILLLSGRCVAYILSQDGEQVHLGFYDAPAVLPPHISRTKDGFSLLNIEMLTPGCVAMISAATLLDLMVDNAAIRTWGNDIMRQQLLHQSTHQWALAALGGKARLLWLREHFEQLEDKFDHWRLASFLAMTPVSFSRIRNALD